MLLNELKNKYYWQNVKLIEHLWKFEIILPVNVFIALNQTF